MDTALVVFLLGIALVAIIALPAWLGRRAQAKPLTLDEASKPARSPTLATMRDVDASPLARWLYDQACRQTGMDFGNDPLALTRIVEAAVKAQTEINESGAASIALPYIGADSKGPKHVELQITREQASSLRHRQ